MEGQNLIRPMPRSRRQQTNGAKLCSIPILTMRPRRLVATVLSGILRVLREAESGHTVGVDAADIGFYRRDALEEKHHRNGRTTIEHPESLQEIACVKQFDLVQGYSY
jgi:hypothetical protein